MKATISVDVDEADLEQLVDKKVTAAVEALPPAKAGEDGKDSTVPGPAPTQAQVDASVADYLTKNPPAGGGAVVGLPFTVISDPAKLNDGIDAWAKNRTPAGFLKTQLVLAFSGTASPSRPLLDPDLPKLQGVRVRGLGKRSTIIAWGDTATPLLTAYGQLQNFELADFSIQSTKAGAKGIYFRSDQSKFNQDGAFRRVEWMGAWDYGIGLDGDQTANLNSELIFDQVAMSNDAAFASAWFWCGMRAQTGGGAQNQFLNYVFRDTKLEGSHGDYIRFDYGGSFSVEGMNSWIHTGQANGGTPAGRMLYLKNGWTGDSTMRGLVDGVRAELRGPGSVLVDSNWGGPSHLVFRGINSAGNAFKFPTPTEQYSIRGGNVKIADSHLQGFIGAYGTPRIVLDEVTTPGTQGLTVQAGAKGSKSLVQTMSGSPTVIIR